MKTKLILSLLGVWVATALGFAINVQKLYKSHPTAKGMLYFVMPQKMQRTAGSTAYADLSFDISCLSSSDSASVTVTLCSAEPFARQQLSVVPAGGGTPLHPTVEVLFRDLGKKGYVNRLRFQLHRNELRRLYADARPYTLDCGGGCTFAASKGKWKQQQLVVSSVLHLADLNQ